MGKVLTGDGGVAILRIRANERPAARFANDGGNFKKSKKMLDEKKPFG